MAKTRQRSSTAEKPPPAAARPVEPPPAVEEAGLEQFARAEDDRGLSLDDLSNAFADLLEQGEIPYEAPPESPPEEAVADEPPEEQRLSEDDGSCELSPRTILEGLLFVGHPDNRPLVASEVAGLMRGVRPEEIDDLVRELNESYQRSGAVYQIVSSGPGYRLELRPAFWSVRDRLYGRLREARLTQAAIDVLAIVAYHQPVNRARIDGLRGRPSLALLNQLVRRQLLLVEDLADQPRSPNYRTTDRFLQLFGLSSLAELPHGQDL